MPILIHLKVDNLVVWCCFILFQSQLLNGSWVVGSVFVIGGILCLFYCADMDLML